MSLLSFKRRRHCTQWGEAGQHNIFGNQFWFFTRFSFLLGVQCCVIGVLREYLLPSLLCNGLWLILLILLDRVLWKVITVYKRQEVMIQRIFCVLFCGIECEGKRSFARWVSILHPVGHKTFKSDQKHFTIIPSFEESYGEAHSTTTTQRGGENKSKIFGFGSIAVRIIYVFNKKIVTEYVFGEENQNMIKNKWIQFCFTWMNLNLTSLACMFCLSGQLFMQPNPFFFYII